VGLDDGEALAPLEATTLEDVAAGASRHPRAETVFALARYALGLPGSFDHETTIPEVAISADYMPGAEPAARMGPGGLYAMLSPSRRSGR
jgi:hypothetical protein